MGNYGRYAEILASLGYDVTPVEGKRPFLNDWQNNPPDAQDYEKHSIHSIGVVLGGKHNLVAVDIDVRNKAACDVIRQIADNELGPAPERVGNAPKTLFLYRCEELTRKRRTSIFEIDEQDACVELLGDGQQFVASGKHPDTGKNYSWVGDKIVDIPPENLTEVSVSDLENFLNICEFTLSNHGHIKSKAIFDGVSQNDATPGFDDGSRSADIARVTEAAAYIPASAVEERSDWLKIGLAIKGATGEAGRELFHTVSAKSDKYDPVTTDKLYDTEVHSAGAGTIIAIAKQHGYVPTATIPEIAEQPEDLGKLIATPFGDVSAEKLPRRNFLYGTHLIEKYVSATIAQGGGSKTTILLTDAIAMAVNKDLIGNAPKYQCRTWHYNLEDPIDELQRRVLAICKRYNINAAEIKDQLFLDSGRTRKLVVAEKVGNIIVATPDVEAVIEQINKHDIKAMSVDPFVKAHHADENDNKQIDSVLDQFARIANETGCAIDLAHHVRKPATGQPSAAGDINQARGASAISGAVRSARTISIMTEKEAEAVGIPADKKNWYIRLDDAKGNMSPPAYSALWLQRESITLDNGDEFEPGDNVGVVSPWTPPDAFDHISIDKARSLLIMISEGQNADVKYSKNKGKRWAGSLLISEVLEMDESKAKTVIKTWLKSGVLYEDDYQNGKTRKDEKGLHVNYELLPKVID